MKSFNIRFHSNIIYSSYHKINILMQLQIDSLQRIWYIRISRHFNYPQKFYKNNTLHNHIDNLGMRFKNHIIQYLNLMNSILDKINILLNQVLMMFGINNIHPKYILPRRIISNLLTIYSSNRILSTLLKSIIYIIILVNINFNLPFFCYCISNCIQLILFLLIPYRLKLTISSFISFQNIIFYHNLKRIHLNTQYNK